MDLQLERLINGAWTSPALDRVMAIASSFDLWLPFVVIAIGLTAWRGRARARWFLAALALTLAIGDGVVSNGLKRAVHRPRPFQVEPGIRQVDLARHARPRLLAVARPLEIKISDPTLEQAVDAYRSGEGRSFPSSHTMNNFGAATVLAWFYRRRGWLYYIPATLVGYSRVYVGSHWASDVLRSAGLAIVLAAAVAAAVDLARRRWERRKLAP